MEIAAWLKKDHGLGHGHAMAIYATFKGKKEVSLLPFLRSRKKNEFRLHTMVRLDEGIGLKNTSNGNRGSGLIGYLRASSDEDTMKCGNLSTSGVSKE